VGQEWRFDTESTREFTRIRQAVIAHLIAGLRLRDEFSSALDVGCGVGYFSRFLADLRFQVLGVDGREENIREAQHRNPDLKFLVANAEEITSVELGSFDFVLCVGLIYHLENPFRALRHLQALTGKVLFLESLTVPGKDPELKLLDEDQGEDQGLRNVAFYPTESCLTKLLYRSGFPFVYGLKVPPEHPILFDRETRRRERSMLVGSKRELLLPEFQLLSEPSFSFGLASGQSASRRPLLSRLRTLLRRSFS
jgi:SAM-dependent methyltransferase